MREVRQGGGHQVGRGTNLEYARILLLERRKAENVQDPFTVVLGTPGDRLSVGVDLKVEVASAQDSRVRVGDTSQGHLIRQRRECAMVDIPDHALNPEFWLFRAT